MKIDLTELNKEIEAGNIKVRRHPELPLNIYNYSEQVQFSGCWTPITMACRGLVLDDNGDTIARPFGKFHNDSQHVGPLPDGAFEVTAKLDGSLGVLFHYDGTWHVATRGSFDSDQAIRAQAIIDRLYGDWLQSCDPRHTILCEIIFRENRIVVDYGDTENLFFIAAIDRETGRDVHLSYVPMPRVKVYDGIEDLSKIRALGGANEEGFVVRWVDSDYRLKYKLEEYVRLHKLVTGVTPLRIWEVMSAGQDFGTFLAGIPDELYRWIAEKRASLEAQYRSMEDGALAIYNLVPKDTDRKTQALAIQRMCTKSSGISPSLVFRMLDGKDYSELIWNAIRPRPPHECFRFAPLPLTTPEG